jgi:signal transduction histidine kinase
MYLVEIGVLVFLLFQVYLLANHYAKSYKNMETLNLNLEKMVEERSGELITANRVKDRLLSVISHDIKSPLNSLRGILHIYNKGAISGEEFTNYSKRLEDELGKTGLLVDNILYWTTSQLKGIEVKLERLDLKEMLNENIELYQSVAANKKISIKNDITEQDVINFDRNILNLTLRNLISNAIKFSHEGGEIIVHTVSAVDSLAIQIIDYGVGMNAEQLRMVEGSEPTTSTMGTSDEKGTGLGLTFCREYLRKAGAELRIDSSLGNGSTFTISIAR